MLLKTLVEALDHVPDDDPVAVAELVWQKMTAYDAGVRLTDHDYLVACVAMTMAEARDEVWRRLTQGQASRFLPFWLGVLARSPQAVRLTPLAVTGVFAWISQAKNLHERCLTQAETIDADYPLVRLLRRVTQESPTVGQWFQAVDDAVARQRLGKPDAVPSRRWSDGGRAGRTTQLGEAGISVDQDFTVVSGRCVRPGR
jgi:hypothetical protein